MAQGYLLDSNVIIGYLAGKIPALGTETISAIVDQIPNISVISQIEVLRHLRESLLPSLSFIALLNNENLSRVEITDIFPFYSLQGIRRKFRHDKIKTMVFFA